VTLLSSTLVDVAHTLVLNCLVFGDRDRNIFSVEIASTKTVGTLRKEILKEHDLFAIYFPSESIL
jgi:Crinkler effector protein N-terminal domain